MVQAPKKTSQAEGFYNLDDFMLIKLYRDGDQAACTALIARYAALIRYRASNYSIAGIDSDDLKQEAYMGLLFAIRSFDSEGVKSNGASFYTYATHCINNRLKNLIAAASTQKAQIYKNLVSFDEMGDTHLTDGENKNPEAIFIQNEDYNSLMTLIEMNLSEFEKDVLFLYLNGCDYLTVAKKLSSSQKSVDNALQRARKKLKAVLNKL